MQEGKDVEADVGEVKVRGWEVGGVGTVGEEAVSRGVGVGVEQEEEGKEAAEKVVKGEMAEKVKGEDEKEGKEEMLESKGRRRGRGGKG